jgi:hypothetical protein
MGIEEVIGLFLVENSIIIKKQSIERVAQWTIKSNTHQKRFPTIRQLLRSVSNVEQLSRQNPFTY